MKKETRNFQPICFDLGSNPEYPADHTECVTKPIHWVPGSQISARCEGVKNGAKKREKNLTKQSQSFEKDSNPDMDSWRCCTRCDTKAVYFDHN